MTLVDWVLFAIYVLIVMVAAHPPAFIETGYIRFVLTLEGVSRDGVFVRR